MPALRSGFSHSRLLRCGAVAHQQRADQFDQAALVGHRGVAARKLLHDERIGQRVETRTALLFRHADAEQAELSHLLVELARKALLPVERLGLRADHVLGELPRHIAHLLVRFAHIHRLTYVTV